MGLWLPWPPPARADAQTVKGGPLMQRSAPDRARQGARRPVSGQSCGPPHLPPSWGLRVEKMLEECARETGGPYSVSRPGAHPVMGRAGAVRRSRLRPVVR